MMNNEKLFYTYLLIIIIIIIIILIIMLAVLLFMFYYCCYYYPSNFQLINYSYNFSVLGFLFLYFFTNKISKRGREIEEEEEQK
jgi:hypothetical protein